MKLLALFAITIGLAVAHTTQPAPATTHESAWPEPGNPMPPYDK